MHHCRSDEETKDETAAICSGHHQNTPACEHTMIKFIRITCINDGGTYFLHQYLNNEKMYTYKMFCGDAPWDDFTARSFFNAVGEQWSLSSALDSVNVKCLGRWSRLKVIGHGHHQNTPTCQHTTIKFIRITCNNDGGTYFYINFQIMKRCTLTRCSVETHPEMTLQRGLSSTLLENSEVYLQHWTR